MRRVLWGVMLACCAAMAQPAFDVASVKVSEDPPFGQNININLGKVEHGELTLGNATLAECIRFSRALISDDQLAGPEWIKSKAVRFDIVAKAAPDTPRERMLEMLQTLLAERFKLAMHQESRIVPHYELTIAKGGLKMTTAAPDASTDQKFGNPTLMRISAPRMPMFRFTMMLSRNLRQAVIDKTGLTGEYAVNLEWAPESVPGGISVFSAIQDQLGLKLEPRKTPTEVLVIDRAEKVPVAN
jgi:uncharacterized protein (TIGR03435 family)